MVLRYAAATFFLMAFAACVSQNTYRALLTEHERIRHDSLLLEKRIRQLSEENNRLATESARMEQAMNNRLQEKEDSLNYKEALLRERELSLKDMKARKEEEREAFMSLARQVTGDFSGYDRQTLVTHTGCTQIIVSLNDRHLFAAGSAKPEPMAAEVNSKALAILRKYPDLQLVIVAYADSNQLSKDRNPDPWQLPHLKATALYRQLTQHEDQPLKARTSTGLKNDMRSRTYPSQVDYVFYSSLLPCIHTR